MVKRNNTLSFIVTYLIIIILFIGINILLYLPINNKINTAKEIDKTYQSEIISIQNSQVENYIKDMKQTYQEYFRIFTNMIIALYVVVAICLVVTGLSLRVNSNRNKGMYNAIVTSGITVILYLIWFIITVPNTFNLLF